MIFYISGFASSRDYSVKTDARGGLLRLPSPRVVSLSNVIDVDVPDSNYALSTMQWGQFIDHDLTHTPIFRFSKC